MRVNSIVQRVTEITIALVLVVGFFLVLLSMLTALLPEGSGLLGLVNPGKLSTRTDQEWIQVATLSDVQRKVKDKPFDGLVWGSSNGGMSLGRQHAIQTFEKSAATIAFGEESEIILGENSLVVIKDYKAEKGDRSRRASMMVLSGELWGRISGGGTDALTVQVVTAGGTSEIGSSKGSTEDASFRIVVHDDQSATISVYEGTAEVSSHGKTVTLKANEALVLGPSEDEEPVFVSPLPDRPTLLAPDNGNVTYYRESPPRIRLKWKKGEGAGSYRLQIARDKKFGNVVYDSRIRGEEHTLGNLTGGTYYWKVIGLAADLEGSASQARSFRLVGDMVAPKLQIDFPSGPVNADHLVLRGKAEPGSIVFIQKVRVSMDRAGFFEDTVALERGLNVVVVEALDRVGNTTYRSEIISAKY